MSRRSDRIIDCVFCRGSAIDMQTYHGDDTSDYKYIRSIVPFKSTNEILDTNIHWENVFISLVNRCIVMRKSDER